MAKLDPIIGRYVTLSQGGKNFRIYFEENGSVYFRQWAEDLKQFQVSILSYNQFLSLVSCLDATDGMFELKLQESPSVKKKEGD